MASIPNIPVRNSSLQSSDTVLPDDAGPSDRGLRSSGGAGLSATEGHEACHSSSGQKSSIGDESNSDLPQLSAQRQELVDDIIQKRQETGPEARLDDAGRAVFDRAGFADRMDRRSDIEVTTNWLPPVVHVSSMRTPIGLLEKD